MIDRFSPVAAFECRDYEQQNVKEALKKIFSAIGLDESAVKGKRILVKPNLLLAYPPEKAATTHPSVVEETCLYLKTLSPLSVIIAESPGGPYNKVSFSHVCNVTGMTAAAENAGVPIAQEFEPATLALPNGAAAKSVDVIKPLYEADVIVNLCKAKTHALAAMTGAGKNLFGLIPGVTKFEMHARFKDPDGFLSMICDLDCEIAEEREIFSVCDAIIGMEGNGPSGGSPKYAGMLLGSRNLFNLDIALAKMMSIPSVGLNSIALKRNVAVAEPEVIGSLPSIPFKPAEATMAKKFRLIPKFLEPKPVINRKICRGCGLCVKSCPQKTISLKNGKAHINPKNCIKCYCCQELCTFKAVKISKSIIYEVVK